MALWLFCMHTEAQTKKHSAFNDIFSTPGFSVVISKVFSVVLGVHKIVYLKEK